MLSSRNKCKVGYGVRLVQLDTSSACVPANWNWGETIATCKIPSKLQALQPSHRPDAGEVIEIQKVLHARRRDQQGGIALFGTRLRASAKSSRRKSSSNACGSVAWLTT